MGDQKISSNSNPMDTDDTNVEENQNAKPCSDDMPTCSSGSSSQSQRFVVTKWEVPARWSWDVLVDLCGICRNQIMDVCIECQAKPSYPVSKEKCHIAWGTCNHAFHFHCISRWLKSRNVCPMDNIEWEYQKFGR